MKPAAPTAAPIKMKTNHLLSSWCRLLIVVRGRSGAEECVSGGDVGTANSGAVGSVKGMKGSGAESLSGRRMGGGGVKLGDRISAMQLGQISFRTRTSGTIALQWGQGIVFMGLSF